MDRQKKLIKFALWAILIIIFSMSCVRVKEMKNKGELESPVREKRGVMEKRKIAIEHFRKGEKYLRDGDLAQAENEAKTAISLDPKHPVPHLLLGDIYYAKKEYKDALYEYQVAQNIDKTKALPHAKIGRVYIELGMNEEAIEAFRTAIELDPDVPGLHKELGNLYRQIGLKDQAEREYRRAEDLLMSGSKYAANQISKISDTQERQGFEHLGPKVERVLKLGDEFLKDGSRELAIKEFKIAVNLKPDSLIKSRAKSTILTGSPMSRMNISPPFPITDAWSTSWQASGMVMK